MAGFPSPCGDYGSYLLKKIKEMKERVSMFPSPCGDYGSYLKKALLGKAVADFKGFRPLAGIMVLIRIPTFLI